MKITEDMDGHTLCLGRESGMHQAFVNMGGAFECRLMGAFSQSNFSATPGVSLRCALYPRGHFSDGDAGFSEGVPDLHEHAEVGLGIGFEFKLGHWSAGSHGGEFV